MTEQELQELNYKLQDDGIVIRDKYADYGYSVLIDDNRGITHEVLICDFDHTLEEVEMFARTCYDCYDGKVWQE